MASATLLQKRTREVHLRNDLKKNGQLELKSNFNINVKYAPNNQNCVATIYQSFEDKSGENAFNASITMEGLFACQGVNTPEDKKALHLQIYDAMFPYLQNAVSQLFADTGLPGFLVKKIPLNQERVNVMDNKPKGGITLPIV